MIVGLFFWGERELDVAKFLSHIAQDWRRFLHDFDRPPGRHAETPDDRRSSGWECNRGRSEFVSRSPSGCAALPFKAFDRNSRRYYIAPTQDVLAIRLNPETKQRTLDALRWGLIPNWAKDPKIAYKTINARVETVDTAPSYRQAFKKRRCLIPADSFYEWKKVVGGKIPYAIGMKDDSPFVFAGSMGGMERSATDEWLRTCTIITGEPNEFVRQIHTRMPVILPEEQHDAWLSGEAGKEILIPFPADRMKAWPISPRVNKPENNDAEISVPVELEIRGTI